MCPVMNISTGGLQEYFIWGWVLDGLWLKRSEKRDLQIFFVLRETPDRKSGICKSLVCLYGRPK